MRNDRLVAVLETRYNPSRFQSLDEVNEHVVNEIEHFVVGYYEANGRVFKSIGRAGPKEALRLVRDSQVPKTCPESAGAESKLFVST